MVTGQKAFGGKSQASLIAAILEHDPIPISELQPVSSAALGRVVKKCLEKDPERRRHSAHDLHDELVWLGQAGSESDARTPPLSLLAGRRLPVPLVAGLLLGGVITGVTVWSVMRPTSDETTVLIEVPVAAELGLAMDALSPDGRHVAFAAGLGGEGIFVRSIDTVEPRLLPGTEGATRLFWSPDGGEIGFWSAANGRLQAIALTGGPVRTLCDPGDIAWATWNGAGVVLFSRGGELFRCSESGGRPTPVTALGNSRQGLQPQFLPDDQHFLFVRTSGPDGPGVYVGSLDSPDATFVVRSVYKAQYAPPGYLLFVRDQALVAQPFDTDALRLTGESVVVAPEVATLRSLGAAMFSSSNTGDVTYQAGGSYETSEFARVDRAGSLLESIGMPGEYDNFAVSPDESQLVVEIPDSTRGTTDLWIHDLTGGGMQRFTFDPSDDRLPIWSSDGESIIFSSARGGGPLQLWQKPTSGVGEAVLLLATDENAVPISSDGKRLVFGFGENRAAGGSGEIGVLDLSGDTETVRMRLTPAGFAAYHYDLSPDGRWISYASDESGQPEVWVQPFPPSGGKWQVSVDRRWQPRWSADGTELFSLQVVEGSIHSVDVDTDGDTFVIRSPRMLFRSPNFFISPAPRSPPGATMSRRMVTDSWLKRFSDSPCTAWARRGTSACTNAGGPMQAYSMDLRERALLDSDAGMKAADVAVKYRVSGSWVRLLKQRRRETGEVAPRVQRHGRRRMLEPHLHTLAALIAEQPDRTLAELKDALGTPASLATIWRAVAALDVTVKKNGPALRTRST